MAEHDQDHPDDVADHVMSAMTPLAGYEDDVAVLIYRHPPAPLTVQMPADDPSCVAVLRAELRQWLAAADIGIREATDIMISAGEATANAFEQAPAGRPADAAPVQITLTARSAPVGAPSSTPATLRTSSPSPATPEIRLNDINGTSMLLERHEWNINVVSGQALVRIRADPLGLARPARLAGSPGRSGRGRAPDAPPPTPPP